MATVFCADQRFNMLRMLLPILLSVSTAIYAQPYIDLGRVSYTHSPMNGLNKKGKPLKSDQYGINMTLPVELQKNGDAIIINPFFDHNDVNLSNEKFSLLSQGVSLGFLNKPRNKDWSIFSVFILRRNKEEHKTIEDDLWQYGGAMLVSWKKNKNVSFKLGLYYNKEFFGNYFMPLAGLDWKIDDKNNLFGVLPGNMTFEHKINRSLYYGLVFRALTGSYRQQTVDPCFSGDCTAKKYLRVDDNQLGLFLDHYLWRNIVFSTEAGYTILRRYREGLKGEKLHQFSDSRNDNFYFRAALSYRIRFR